MVPNEPTGIKASCEVRGGETWVHLDGELDNEGCDHVAPILQETDGAIVVDMSGVTFVSSEGIGLLIKAHRELQEKDRTLVLHGLRPHIRKSFERVGALMVLPERG